VKNDHASLYLEYDDQEDIPTPEEEVEEMKETGLADSKLSAGCDTSFKSSVGVTRSGPHVFKP